MSEEKVTILACAACDNDTFYMFPDGHIRCSNCEGQMNARVTVGKPIPAMSNFSLSGEPPEAEA